jgi:transglutaminase-like putative cysteine protease
MRFEVLHVTSYRYSEPAVEAYLETRLAPPDTATQKVLEHRIDFDPSAPTSSYIDWFGNRTDFYAMTLRHDRLAIRHRAVIETAPASYPEDALDLTIAEARQVFSSCLLDHFDYVEPTPFVPFGGVAADWAVRHLPGHRSIRNALVALNAAIHRHFTYESGSTNVSTPIRTVWKQRRGVCQDFAHVMLSILRTAGLPARYVCGYIESEPSVPRDAAAKPRRRLVGSIATHAWVEVLIPGLTWVALDPTNNKWCGEQHVAVSYGRDFDDASPVRGTFKGAGTQTMKVKVSMKRLDVKR